MHIVEYKLRFLLNSLTLRVVTIKNLAKPKELADFNSRFYDGKKIQGFCSRITETTRFPVFNVPLSKDSKMHTVLFCEVAVGRSSFVNNQYAETLDPSSKFDSLITNNEKSVDFLHDRDIDITKCEYVIKNTERILPLYEVVFEYDEEFERERRGRMVCLRCRKNDAVVFCPSEVAEFCEECDKEIHFDAFLSQHDRIYFSEAGQKKFIVCAYHPKKVVEYFCDECKEPICAECQITGKHSTADYAGHQIKPFLDACRTAQSMVADSTAMLASIDEVAQRNIAKFKDSVDSFRKNIADLRRRLNETFDNLNKKLGSIESKHRMVFNAKHIENVALWETGRRMVAYPNSLDAADLLLNIKNITEQLEQCRMPVFEDVQIPEVTIEGRMAVGEVVAQPKKVPCSKADDRIVALRVETMNLDSKVTEVFK